MSKGGGHREHYEGDRSLMWTSATALVDIDRQYRSPLREQSLEELRSGASIIAEARSTAWRWTIRTGVLLILVAAAIGWWLT